MVPLGKGIIEKFFPSQVEKEGERRKNMARTKRRQQKALFFDGKKAINPFKNGITLLDYRRKCAQSHILDTKRKNLLEWCWLVFAL